MTTKTKTTAPPLAAPPPPAVNHDASGTDAQGNKVQAQGTAQGQGAKVAGGAAQAGITTDVQVPDGVDAANLPQTGSIAGASPYDPPGVGAGPSVDAIKAAERQKRIDDAKEKAGAEIAARDGEIARSPFTPPTNPGDVPQTRGTAGDPNDGKDHGGGKPTEAPQR